MYIIPQLFGIGPPKVLSIRQPWAWLVASGRKPIENRTWQTDYRGRLYIHAGKRPDEVSCEEIADWYGVVIDRTALEFGAIVGRVDLIDIVTSSRSPWFSGPFGWVVANPVTIQPFRCGGRLGLFDLPAGFRE